MHSAVNSESGSIDKFEAFIMNTPINIANL